MNITLYFKEGSSDKVYHVTISPKDQGWVVNFAYGRRGSTLTTGTKTATPVSYEDAQRIFNKLVAEKAAKGYSPGADGTPYAQTGNEGRSTGIHCQLLNPVDNPESLLACRRYWMQEKHDGRRLLIQKEGDIISGINRLGLSVALPQPLINSAKALPADFIMDGEAVGDILHAFDILSYRGNDLRRSAYRDRYLVLFNLLAFANHANIRLVEAAVMENQKRQLFDELKSSNKEGVVFKDADARYTAGRPNTGGSQFKFKFCETASFIVNGHNGKRSVMLALMNGENLVSAGNVTIPPNQDIPPIGAVIEVRFLYAFKESGCIYQPVYLGPRDDIPTDECTVDQLKYKSASVAA